VYSLLFKNSTVRDAFLQVIRVMVVPPQLWGEPNAPQLRAADFMAYAEEAQLRLLQHLHFGRCTNVWIDSGTYYSSVVVHLRIDSYCCYSLAAPGGVSQKVDSNPFATSTATSFGSSASTPESAAVAFNFEAPAPAPMAHVWYSRSTANKVTFICC
jgi:hypothetical protein